LPISSSYHAHTLTPFSFRRLNSASNSASLATVQTTRLGWVLSGSPKANVAAMAACAIWTLRCGQGMSSRTTT
jgi:hypothetical protein